MEFGIFTQFDLRNEQSVHDSITEWVDLAFEADQMGVELRPFRLWRGPQLVSGLLMEKVAPEFK